MAQRPLQQPDVRREPAGEFAGSMSAKKPGGCSSSSREQFPPERRHRALAGSRQQVGLDVVEHGLHHHKPHQAEGDAIEQRPVPWTKAASSSRPMNMGSARLKPALRTRQTLASASAPAVGRMSGRSRLRAVGGGRRRLRLRGGHVEC